MESGRAVESSESWKLDRPKRPVSAVRVCISGDYFVIGNWNNWMADQMSFRNETWSIEVPKKNICQIVA